MANTVINIDVGNLVKTAKKFEEYSHLVAKAMDDGFKEFAGMYETKLIENMAAYGVPESILGTVYINTSEKGLQVFIASDLVYFFEYGTGLPGASNPHPKVPAGWVYDVNGHGEKGWWYPTTSSDPNPYKWTDKSGQLRAWTRGKASRPFLYKTNMWARRSITNVVRKHIRRIKID